VTESGAAAGGATFNLSGAGSVVNAVGTVAAQGIALVMPGIYRIWYAVTTTSTSLRIGIGVSSGSGYASSTFPNGANGSTINAGFAQIEPVATSDNTPTSFIQTTTASQTRGNPSFSWTDARALAASSFVVQTTVARAHKPPARSAANALERHQASVAGTTVSTNLPVWPTYIGARNNVNSINGQSNDLYSAALIGGVLTDDQIASVYMADLEYLTDIVCPGDSLTASPSTGAGPYPKQLGLLFSPTRTASNQGIGGQTSTQIAARMGAQPITVTVTNNQIPASGGVAVTAKNINVLTNFNGFTFAGSMVPARLPASMANMTHDDGGRPTWTFTRFTAGIVTSCPGGTQCGSLIFFRHSGQQVV
jgi:hypothetical protein